MLPSNPIPQVCNYGSSATYCSCPTDEQIAAGVIPLDSLPAAWWNWMWSKTNQAVNCARFTVGTLITELNTVLTQAGVCSCDACTDQLYQAITKLRRIVGDADYPGAVKSSTTPGQVSIDANGVMTANCVGNATQLTTSSHTLVGAVNELKTTYDCCISDINSALGGKAPTGHASSDTTYGVGSAANYGHLKISDTYTSVLEACSGVAASQYALATAYSALANAGYTTLGNTAGCALGTAAAGTATTAAHSDHVHPLPTCVANAGNAACLGGLYSTCYEQKANLGTAAYCAAGCFRASTWTPSLVACSRVVWNRPGSTEASKVCNVMFYAGCSNASCAATNYAACICGSNGWMYGLAGIYTPNIRANDPGSTASKTCNIEIKTYRTDASCNKTTTTFTFCGDGYMHGYVCGNLCGLACLALSSAYVCKTAATANANRQVLLGEATESAGYGSVYYGNACKLTFNPATGALCSCWFCGYVCGARVNTSCLCSYSIQKPGIERVACAQYVKNHYCTAMLGLSEELVGLVSAESLVPRNQIAAVWPSSASTTTCTLAINCFNAANALTSVSYGWFAPFFDCLCMVLTDQTRRKAYINLYNHILGCNNIADSDYIKQYTGSFIAANPIYQSGCRTVICIKNNLSKPVVGVAWDAGTNDVISASCIACVCIPVGCTCQIPMPSNGFFCMNAAVVLPAGQLGNLSYLCCMAFDTGPLVYSRPVN